MALIVALLLCMKCSELLMLVLHQIFQLCCNLSPTVGAELSHRSIIACAAAVRAAPDLSAVLQVEAYSKHSADVYSQTM